MRILLGDDFRIRNLHVGQHFHNLLARLFLGGWGVPFGADLTSNAFNIIGPIIMVTKMMLLCFFIGATHLTIAHAWTALRSLRTPQALAQVGWIMTTWTMYFLARNMVLGEVFPAVMGWVCGLGVLLIVLFMTPPAQLKSEWFNHVMLPLSLVSNFVDVVSYLRLFAVGSASLAVAMSFNDMALSGVDSVVKGLFAALILFFGHALNIVLSAMGVLVHGVRLNTLEFSSHIGMQWKGRPYAPFAKHDSEKQTV